MPAIKFGNAASLLAAALALSSTSAVLAQEPPLEAQASRTATFDIPSQPLAQALTAFGRQSGMQIAVDTAAVAGKTSGSVSGTMTAEQALRQLLAGSGLTYQFTSANAVTVAGAAPGAGLERRAARSRARAGRRTAGAGRDRQPAAALRRRPGRARRQGRPARQPRLHGHAVQRDDLHREVHAESAGAHADRRARRRSHHSPGLAERQRVRRPRHDPRHPRDQPQLRAGRPLRHRARPGGHDRRRTGRGVPRPLRLPERRPAERRRRHHQPGAQARHQRADHPGERALPVRRPARRHGRYRPPLRSRPVRSACGPTRPIPAAIRR